MIKLKSRIPIPQRAVASISWLRQYFENTGRLTAFAGSFFVQVFTPPFEWRELLLQCYKIGYKTLSIVAITGFIMGMVLTLQSRPTLADFGAESWLPGMVALSLIREIAPVITALICAGKIGSGIGAELGSMKVTEQIDAMEVSAVNPFKYLVVTRILATTLMIPILVIFSDAIGLLGAYTAINISGDVSLTWFISHAFSSVGFDDFFPATIKTFFFGFFIGLIGCFKGYNAANGTESVGKAANAAVVTGSISIFVIDVLAVQLTDLLT
jgi:phospholipid/cholesterol/gamma-HCH transport system permease protein